ncbi:hypothetical protein DFP93_101324 [Aneurinibacillus soli]|uniref:Uncharacterized protein n=1 Tax=Aneurinibacillus soli TaxID=1500254 RepID=A0A0U5BDG1_9BACL|nr:hypothetical protein [Aneurinibacillus soli]PYE64298.1 hypothetical protein DFP93_101324 [Aneurinibacillus soli]BAU28247.1 hypothetical protein CB4_02421 [Aneurinibacillus soli]
MQILQEEFGEQSIYEWLAYRLKQMHREVYGDEDITIVWTKE